MALDDADAVELHLHQLLDMLLAYPTVLLSGERLAQQLGLSRSTVWQGMEQLRGYGVELSGHPGLGYQLTAMPDLLVEPLLRPALRSPRFGARIRHFFRTGSTQQAALEAATAGAVEGSFFVAETQNRGRGRQGHTWASPPAAGIYGSLVLRPAGPPADLLPLTLTAGLAVADAVEAATAITPEIRWPNDLLLDGKKFCGLLLEMAAEATRIEHAVLGFGINVKPGAVPDELSAIATSLGDHASRPLGRIPLCAAVLRRLEHRCGDWGRVPRQGLIEEFEARCAMARGREVVVGGSGAEPYHGRTEGLDPNGFLRVRTPAGELRTVLSGDVRPFG